MKKRLFITILLFTLLPAVFANAKGATKFKSSAIVVQGFFSGDTPITLSVEEKGKYSHEDFVDSPVYRLVSLSNAGVELESRQLDFVVRIGSGGCKNLNADCSRSTKTKRFSIYMKNFPHLERFQLKKDGVVVTEKVISK